MGESVTKGRVQTGAIVASIAASTVISILIGLYCLKSGIFIIFQNLFYIPIIISCIFYLRKGFIFSIILSLVYLAMISVYAPNSTIIIEALIRVGIFFIVAGVITVLSYRLKKYSRVEIDTVFNSSPSALLVLDETTSIVKANAAAVVMCGGNEYDVLKHRPGNALHCAHSMEDPLGCGYAPDCSVCPARKGIEGLLAGGGAISGAELPLDLVRDGRVRKTWLKLSANQLLINGRKHLCVALDDITENKKLDNALRESEDKYRSLFENADYAILLFADGKWDDCNEGALKVFGCTREQVIGEHPIRFSPAHQPDGRNSDVEAVRLINLAYTTGPQTFEWVHCRADGTLFDAEVCLNRLDLKGKQYIQAIVRDVSDHKRIEKIRESNSKRTQALMKLNQMIGAELKEITDFALEEVVRLTGSKIGYLAFLNPDESVLTMHSWSKSAMAECAINEKPIIYPVMATGLWGEAVRQRKPIITNDYLAANPLKKGIPSGHVALKRHMNVPVFEGERIVIVAGVGNKEEPYSEEDVQQIRLLMEGMWRMLERQRLYQDLRLSEDRYRSILEGSPDQLLFLGLDGKVNAVSRAGVLMAGYEGVEELVGRNFSENFLPDEGIRAAEHISSILSGRETGVVEYHVVRKDGSLVEIEAKGQIVKNSQGEDTGLMFIVRDITERKRNERRELMVREVMELINGADSSVDIIKSILVVIKKYAGFDAVGIRMRRGEDYPYYAQDGFSNEFIIKENSLLVRDAAGDVCRDESGKVSLECTCGLVIEGKADPNNPLFTKAGSAWTGNSLPFLEVPLDQDPRLHPRNTCIHFGYKSIAIIPLRSGNEVVGILHMNDRREGRFTEEIVRFYEGVGNSIGIALTRKMMEEDLVQKKNRLEMANQELESFSYSVAHDLRAPIRAMDGFSKAVLEDYGDKLDGEGSDYLARIRGASQRMGHLIDDILKLSRISRQEMQKESINLSELAESCIRNLRAAQPDRTVAVDIMENIVVNADASLMQVVMSNLLGNSWKFTGKDSSPRISFGMREENGKKEYFVRDNGAGFDPAHADKLFGAFQRLHSAEEFEGTGIGLATVRRVVHRHGGRIWAEGQIGAGATFYFTL